MTAEALARSAGLAGIRVLELGELVSAPYATKLLADLGAEVIKVEGPSGDRARRRGPYRHGANPDASGLFLALNTNKRSVVVSEANAPDLLPPLLADADGGSVNGPVGSGRSRTSGPDVPELEPGVPSGTTSARSVGPGDRRREPVPSVVVSPSGASDGSK